MRVAVLAPLIACLAMMQSADQEKFQISPDHLLAHIRFLASDELGGRGNGTPELRRAADYVASEFKKAGLEPGGDHGHYFQAFDITSRLDRDSTGTVTFSSSAGATSFRIGIDYYPLSQFGTQPSTGSPSARESNPVAFAGYGIAAPGLGYDDYAGLDVEGKAVIVFTHEPQEHDYRSVFEGRRLTPHSDIANKAALARRRGATLLIVIDDPSHLEDRVVNLPQAWISDPQVGEFDLPVIRVGRTRLQRLFVGLDFDAAARGIDRTLKPQSRTLTDVSVSYTRPLVSLSPRGQNVVGVLRGSDATLATAAIVIGAHYDHLGLGGRFSQEPQTTPQIHNGADDNASGTSVVIAMAEAAAKQKASFKRSIVFTAFSGEELGLLGSRHYVRTPPISIRKTVAMLNLDMVGRAHGRVLVGGIDRGTLFRSLIDKLRPFTFLRFDDFRQGGYGRGASDNDAFEVENVPTLLFFTGFHDDYHRASDDWQLIDAAGAAEIARVALVITSRIANRAE